MDKRNENFQEKLNNNNRTERINMDNKNETKSFWNNSNPLLQNSLNEHEKDIIKELKEQLEIANVEIFLKKKTIKDLYKKVSEIYNQKICIENKLDCEQDDKKNLKIENQRLINENTSLKKQIAIFSEKFKNIMTSTKGSKLDLNSGLSSNNALQHKKEVFKEENINNK